MELIYFDVEGRRFLRSGGVRRSRISHAGM